MGTERGRSRGAESAAVIADADDVELVRTLFREYEAGLGVDLCFQGFDEEVASLPAGYDALLVASVDGEPAGCIGVRPLIRTGARPESFDPRNRGAKDRGLAPGNLHGICEMKRLYVRPSARGHGVGRALAVASIERARELGYSRMRLDNLPSEMGAAYALYQTLGFVEIEPYTYNPYDGVKFMELPL